MKKTLTSFSIALVALLLGSFQGFSQQTPLPCPTNIDWEMGDTTGWMASYGGPTFPTPAPSGGVSTGPNPPLPGTVLQTTITTPNMNFISGRTDIMNTSMPNDPIGNFPVVPSNGGQYAFRLGDQTPNNGAEKVSFTFTVPAVDDYAIKMMYAVVIENPDGHTPEQMPRLTITVKDAAGNKVKDGCYDRNFIAASGLPGFFDAGGVIYKPWTELMLNLKGTANQTLTLEITTGDCSLGGHWGYGYFDVVGCTTIEDITMDSCNLDLDGAYFSAPEGYMTYNWYNNDYSQLVDTGRYPAFQPIGLTPEIYHLVAIPYPSVSLCNDTFNTDPLANITLDKPDTTCLPPNTSIQINLNAQGGVNGLTYQWTEFQPGSTLSCTNCASPTSNTSTSKFYTALVTDDAGCKKSEIISIGVNENSVDVMDDFVLCHPGYTQLGLDILGPQPLTPVECGINMTGCTTPLIYEAQSLYREKQPFGGRFDTSSLNNPFAAHHSSGHMQFILNRNDLYNSGFRYGTFSSIGFQVAALGLPTIESFVISMSCIDLDSIGGTFETNTNVVYTAPAPFSPILGWNDFTLDSSFNWDTAKSVLVDICYTVMQPDDTDRYVVVLANTGVPDAIAAYTNTLGSSICQGATAEQTAFYTGRPTTRLGWCAAPVKPFEYTWTPGLYLSDSTAKDPLAYISETTKFYVTSIGGSDCPVIDSVTVTVPIHDYEIFPKDTSVCLYEPFQLTAGGTFKAVQWYEYDEATNTFTIPTSLSCDGCADPNKIPNPIATPALDTSKYAVVYTDKDNCSDTLYMDYEIRPLPPVSIINNDTIIKYGQDIMLLATGGFLYTWTPSATLSNPNVVNPMASPKEPTLYYVYGIGENGCRKIDSVLVDIDYSSNLFVPTAFTPNGDGKNDVFRVSNITFQRLQEFRVYNRWGQELFSTTDIKKGWDGSFKGQPQDMGIYQYIIKLATPEGKIETYKGDVMLVR